MLHNPLDPDLCGDFPAPQEYLLCSKKVLLASRQDGGDQLTDVETASKCIYINAIVASSQPEEIKGSL